ncbi:MAG: Glycosyltransferase [Parcubacteria group bacterium GW2011_GWA2_47_10]|nr:MAG: Glycosyltransferase [Parcubacteria group bacterium GW2011_GWA2_47_10]
MKKRKLRIGQISPLNIAIPPPKYGGTERVIYNLCEGLTKRGHEVVLFGTGADKTSAKLYPIFPKGLWSLPQESEKTSYYTYAMSKIARAARKYQLDVLHDHLGPLALSLYGMADRIPIVHTLHVPTNNDRAAIYKLLGARLVSISNNQRKPYPRLDYIATVYNGVDTDIYAFHALSKEYMLFVGEMSTVKRNKGILEAIAVAEKTEKHLIVAGKVPSPNQKEDYAAFRERVAPALKKKCVTYVGEVNEKQLVPLYQNAKAVLFPIQWEEPFGLVMIEAMACGTPVIAFQRGSVPEVIVDGKTGYIVSTVNEMARAVSRIDQIDRGMVRKYTEDNFSKERMVDEYEKLYYELCPKQE